MPATKKPSLADRLVAELTAQQDHIDALEAERDRWRDLAVSHALERDSLRRTLADLLEIHPASIVAPVSTDSTDAR